jgi:hypothetical protein
MFQVALEALNVRPGLLCPSLNRACYVGSRMCYDQVVVAEPSKPLSSTIMDVWVTTNRYIETKGQTFGLEVTTASLQVDIHVQSSSAYLVSEQDEVILLWPLPFLRMVEMVKRVLIFGICMNLTVVLESLAPSSPSYQPMSCQSALLAP